MLTEAPLSSCGLFVKFSFACENFTFSLAQRDANNLTAIKAVAVLEKTLSFK